jgi:hypothetical protein
VHGQAVDGSNLFPSITLLPSKISCGTLRPRPRLPLNFCGQYGQHLGFCLEVRSADIAVFGYLRFRRRHWTYIRS